MQDPVSVEGPAKQVTVESPVGEVPQDVPAESTEGKAGNAKGK
jgi:hypothetical protein